MHPSFYRIVGQLPRRPPRRTRSAATLKRWRCEGVGPSWIEIEGRVSYDVAVLLEYIRKNTRMPSVRAMQEDTRGVA